jgi:hypothetical protein
MGLTGPGRPEKTAGRSDCRITGETTAAHADVISAIDSARLPFLPDGTGRLPRRADAAQRRSTGRGISRRGFVAGAGEKLSVAHPRLLIL